MFTAGECRLVCTSSAVLVKEKLKVFTVFSLCLCMDIIVFVETRSWNLFWKNLTHLLQISYHMTAKIISLLRDT